MSGRGFIVLLHPVANLTFFYTGLNVILATGDLEPPYETKTLISYLKSSTLEKIISIVRTLNNILWMFLVLLVPTLRQHQLFVGVNSSNSHFLTIVVIAMLIRITNGSHLPKWWLLDLMQLQLLIIILFIFLEAWIQESRIGMRLNQAKSYPMSIILFQGEILSH